MTIQSLVQLLGGVGIFLFAIKCISESLQCMAGDRLRGLLAMLTRTPLLGVLMGAGVTALMQSSSATTVMTVSFVEAGLLNLTQAIGVIMGANIGTTITGQILAVNVKDYIYVLIIVGVPMSFFCTSWRKHLGNALLGFGLLFVGMQTMEGAMAFLRQRQDIFLAFSHNPFLGLLAGLSLTLLVQSSAATVGLTMALGVQGLLPLHAAIPIILGDNIGTTITAVLAAIGTRRAAQQACAAHVLFNVVGVAVWLPLMPLYIGFLESTASGIGHQIANAHSLFNICNTLLFLPFIGIFARCIRRLIPDAPARPGVEQVRFLDPKLILVSPGIAVEAVRHECRHMGEVVLELTDAAESVFFGGDVNTATQERIAALEDSLDALHTAILAYANNILRAGIADDATAALRRYMACAGNLERIGDSGKRLLEFYTYRRTHEGDFAAESLQGSQLMFRDARSAVALTLRCFDGDGHLTAPAVLDLAASVRETEARLRDRHMRRLASGACGNPAAGLIFIDVLSALEHMAYRAAKVSALLASDHAAPDRPDPR